jgi:NAD(P)-dependent dehydrogenase (short-subunit alcohol dehydrogenase family)
MALPTPRPGHVAVVTGASKGIGLAIVRTLLAEGARVVAASRTPLPALDGELLHVPIDLMDPAAPAEVIARAAETFGGLDILVNNLGGPPPGDRLPHSGRPSSSSTCCRRCAPAAPRFRCWSSVAVARS